MPYLTATEGNFSITTIGLSYSLSVRTLHSVTTISCKSWLTSASCTAAKHVDTWERETTSVNGDLRQKQRQSDDVDDAPTPEDVINDGSWFVDSECLGVISLSGLMQQLPLKWTYALSDMTCPALSENVPTTLMFSIVPCSMQLRFSTCRLPDTFFFHLL